MAQDAQLQENYSAWEKTYQALENRIVFLGEHASHFHVEDKNIVFDNDADIATARELMGKITESVQ